jgi:Mg-chelatase subunit ChlD
LPLSSDLDAINTAIMMQTSTGLGTATDLALLEAKNMLEASTRPDAARAILIITDGQSNNPAQTAVAADIVRFLCFSA